MLGSYFEYDDLSEQQKSDVAAMFLNFEAPGNFGYTVGRNGRVLSRKRKGLIQRELEREQRHAH